MAPKFLTHKIFLGWAGVTGSAIAAIAISKIILNRNKAEKFQEMDVQQYKAGEFVGPSTVERKSKYEGAGNSYMGRVRGADKLKWW